MICIFCGRECRPNNIRRHEASHDPGGIEMRFWQKVDTTGGRDACWPWLAYRNWKGYGEFVIEHRPTSATRYVWQLLNGPIPERHEVCHTCDNPPCVNPSHLFVGTKSDNMQDMVAKGRAPRGSVAGTHCRRGHEMPERWERAGRRQCIVCANDARRARRARAAIQAQP